MEPGGTLCEMSETDNSANPAKNNSRNTGGDESKMGGRSTSKSIEGADFKSEMVSDGNDASVEIMATEVESVFSRVDVL